MTNSVRPLGYFQRTVSVTNATPVSTVPAPAAKSTADRFVESAQRFLGQPFAWGGGHEGPLSQPGPVDASGLVQQAGRMAGLKLVGSAAMQQRQGKPVALKDVRPGDLMFKGEPATFVGIYVGDGKAIAATKPGSPVRYISASYFDSARRVAEPAAPTGGSAEPAAPTGGSQAPIPSLPMVPAAPKGTYTVKFGDSLWRIARQELGDGDRWQEIYAMNPHTIQRPNMLVPGMVLKMPSLEPSGSGAGATPHPFFNDDDF